MSFKWDLFHQKGRTQKADSKPERKPTSAIHRVEALLKRVTTATNETKSAKKTTNK